MKKGLRNKDPRTLFKPERVKQWSVRPVMVVVFVIVVK